MLRSKMSYLVAYICVNMRALLARYNVLTISNKLVRDQSTILDIWALAQRFHVGNVIFERALLQRLWPNISPLMLKLKLINLFC